MRRMAMTKDGKFSYCCSPDNKLGKGRCNHIAIQSENETVEGFVRRNEEEARKLSVKNIPNISKFDFSLPTNYFEERTAEQVVKEYIHLAAINLRLKNAIKTNAKYFFAKPGEEQDPQLVSEAIKEKVPNKEAFDAEVQIFKSEHSDWYEQIPVQKTYKPSEEDKLRAQLFVDSIQGDEAKCYWFFKTKSELDEYKSYMKGKPEFMTTKSSLKKEYKEQYQEFVKGAYERTGYPGESAIKATVTKMVPAVKYTQLRAIEINVPESSTESSLFFEAINREVELPEENAVSEE